MNNKMEAGNLFEAVERLPESWLGYCSAASRVMQQTTSLAANESAAVLETSLKANLVGDAYGSLATIPVIYCVPARCCQYAMRPLMRRIDVWRSFLIVVREMLKSTSFLELLLDTTISRIVSSLN